MKKKLINLSRIVLLLLSQTSMRAFADEITLYKGEPITVTVNSSLGTLIEFPYPVQVVSDSASFAIEQVATQVTKDGSPVNVTLLKVKPKTRTPGQTIERVPVVMTGRRTVTLRFVSSDGAPRHHRLMYPQNNEISRSFGSFLETETALMQAMLVDDSRNGFSRAVLNQDLSIEGYDNKLNMTLVRRFEGSGLFGYTFQIQNKTASAITLSPTTLNFGTPNRAVLLQVDHERLEPCAKNASPVPGANGCMTALRLVVRSDRFVPPTSASELPFRFSSGGKE